MSVMDASLAGYLSLLAKPALCGCEGGKATVPMDRLGCQALTTFEENPSPLVVSS